MDADFLPFFNIGVIEAINLPIYKTVLREKIQNFFLRLSKNIVKIWRLCVNVRRDDPLKELHKAET